MEFQILEVFNKYFGNFDLLPSIELNLRKNYETGKYELLNYDLVDNKGNFYKRYCNNLEFLAELANKFGSMVKFYGSADDDDNTYFCYFTGNNYTKDNIFQEFLENKQIL